MKKQNRTWIYVLIVFLVLGWLFLSSKQGNPNPAPTETPQPTAAPEVTVTPDITPTPEATPEPASTTEPTAETAVYTAADLKNLKHTEHFKSSTIEHIFLGTLKGKKATGYHYDGITDSPGTIDPKSRSELDEHGVYNAKVYVNGVAKKSNNGYSSFYPDTYSPQEVIDAINEAYENCEFISGNLYAGLTSEGMEIDIALDNKGKIITAYPIWEGE